MQQLSVVIIEDDSRSTSYLRQFISNRFPELTVIATGNSVQQSIRLIRELKPDIVLMDIRIIGGSGFDVLEAVPAEQRNFSLIFVSDLHEFALRAFRANAVDFVMKPVDARELEAACMKAIELRRRRNEHAQQSEKIRQLLNYIEMIQHDDVKILLEFRERALVVPLNYIVYCESDHNYTVFHLLNGESLRVRGNISAYEKRLCANNFFRAHRSCIINLAFVSEIGRESQDEGGYIVLCSGVRVKLPKSRREELLALIQAKTAMEQPMLRT